jgi:hypothetical protein
MGNRREVPQNRRLEMRSRPEGRQSAMLLAAGLVIAIALPWLLRGRSGTPVSEHSSSTPPTTAESAAVEGANRP